MKRYFSFLSLCLLGLNSIHSQQKVEGIIKEADAESKHSSLSGANVYWLNSPIGTITNENGLFSIPYHAKYNKLVISYIGYQSDTLTIDEPKMISHSLQPANKLNEVVVKKERESIQKAFFSAQNMVTVNSAELLKAACCNLSESFETNPAIDVNFNDALTGTKQIQMLGLTSPYVLITQENIPMIRGASQTSGVSFATDTFPHQLFHER